MMDNDIFRKELKHAERVARNMGEQYYYLGKEIAENPFQIKLIKHGHAKDHEALLNAFMQGWYRALNLDKEICKRQVATLAKKNQIELFQEPCNVPCFQSADARGNVE